MAWALACLELLFARVWAWSPPGLEIEARASARLQLMEVELSMWTHEIMQLWSVASSHIPSLLYWIEEQSWPTGLSLGLNISPAFGIILFCSSGELLVLHQLSLEVITLSHSFLDIYYSRKYIPYYYVDNMIFILKLGNHSIFVPSGQGSGFCARLEQFCSV